MSTETPSEPDQQPKRRGRPPVAAHEKTVRIQVRVPMWLAYKLEAQGGLSRRAREILESWGRDEGGPDDGVPRPTGGDDGSAPTTAGD